MGNRRTPNVAVYFYHKEPYSPKGGPIIRMIADMGDDLRILAALDTGNEQRPGNPHQNDLMDLFHSGLYIELASPVNGSKWPKGDKEKIMHINAIKSDGTTTATTSTTESEVIIDQQKESAAQQEEIEL